MLSTPSLGITEDGRVCDCSGRAGDHFQLPLSGSRVPVRKIEVVQEPTSFQLPLSGSQIRDELGRRGVVVYLSTPSLGITASSMLGKTCGLCPNFNSLSRDHVSDQESQFVWRTHQASVCLSTPSLGITGGRGVLRG